MTKRSAETPTATERIAEQLRLSRTAGGWDQATVAAVLTALGSPTRTSTITRIEAGLQPPTIEQALLLALISGRGGLRDLLVPPFTFGDITVHDAEGLEALLGGSGDTWTDLDSQAAPRIKTIWDDRRHKMIAETLGATPAKVARASERLYGRGADKEITERFKNRLAEISPTPKPESAQWRAYRTHAVRAVTKEIGEAL